MEPNNVNEQTTSYERNQLAYLDDLEEWQVSQDDTDVRGWMVYTANGEIVGKIKRMVVAPAQLRVRYLDVELDHEVTNAFRDMMRRLRGVDERDAPATFNEDDKNVLIPIGLAQIDEEQHKVWVPGLSISTYYLLPRHRHGTLITPAYEADVVTYYDRNYLERSGKYDRMGYHPDRHRDSDYMDDHFYDCEYFHDRELAER
ncbi:PRC-barrel domain-containing protein [Flavilitoribacter nigricans]|uniref:PRC-barrel domain-containing protein n=1 Tax=Flavilitoribacter nigricans (strain ATCC 23147 / DSM 23189 / NBRC 102662 / NCIMB 1420 / SS-2) TaxID=1122177 RepID=A0A2D0NFB1_FLAN2|nr:PRC-barrel domain-containing protein [Flavilitoribacter nigricans]PHN07182.1 hypothetical protein CRP01_08125 [Flavilitoribacter nigricans DSM 23189 = NBRC 102662]